MKYGLNPFTGKLDSVRPDVTKFKTVTITTGLTVTGGISAPDGTAEKNECYGLGAYIGDGGGYGNTVIGAGAYMGAGATWMDQSTVIGADAYSTHRGNTAIGYGANCTGGYAVAIGVGATNAAANSIVIGPSCQAVNYGVAAIGYGATAAHPRSLALGWGVGTEQNSELIWGSRASEADSPSFRIAGATSQYTGQSMFRVKTGWIDYTDATRKAYATLSTYDTAEREFLTGYSTGTGVNVGIGTATPDVKLHVSTTDATAVIRLERNDATVTTDDILGRIEVETQDTTDPGICAKIEAIAYGSSGETGWRISGGTPTALVEHLRIDNTGAVGIGVTDPAEKLQVKGNVMIGDGEASVDYSLTFDGETNNGIVVWMEDEDYFDFMDTIKLSGGIKSSDGSPGWTGTFTDNDSKTVTVKNGIITDVT